MDRAGLFWRNDLRGDCEVTEILKEAIRRLYFFLVYLGLANEEIEAMAGTLKYRFLGWLYGSGEPQFNVQWPEDEK